MTQIFSFGDRVRTTKNYERCYSDLIGTIKGKSPSNKEVYAVEFDIPSISYHSCGGNCASSNGYYIIEDCLELIDKKEKIMSKLTEKFALFCTKEPQRSFRKAGITNGDNLLTEEGQKVFLSWLLNEKFADEFKTAVVDDIVKDIAEEK